MLKLQILNAQAKKSVRILHFDVLLSVLVLLKVLSNEIDMVEITVGSSSH
jgi:hypothetical protein